MKKSLILMVVLCFVATSTVMGHDSNPPNYRGDPLSVWAHWESIEDGYLNKLDWDWVDDDNPSTYIFPDPLAPDEPWIELGGNLEEGYMYYFGMPNFVDDLPLKLLRLQLYWTGSYDPPDILEVFGEDRGTFVTGAVTFTSTQQIFTPDGSYQYFDIELRPNPCWEILVVQLAPGATLEQVMIDSISIPEPASLAILSLGGLVLLRRRR